MNKQKTIIGFLVAILAAMTGHLVQQNSRLHALRQQLAESEARNQSTEASSTRGSKTSPAPPSKNKVAANRTAPAPENPGGEISKPRTKPVGSKQTAAANPDKTSGPDPLPAGSGAVIPRPAITLAEAQAMVAGKTKVAGKGPAWSHEQITGPPDTEGGSDVNTAWAPRSTRSGEQWVQLGYDQSVEISGVNVHETYCPGALSKVTALMPDGSEKILWTGREPAADPSSATEVWVPAPPGITSNQIRIYVDTDRVQSWPEIDAVELVGANGRNQWANSSTASSFYGDPQSIVERSNPQSAIALPGIILDSTLQVQTGAENLRLPSR